MRSETEFNNGYLEGNPATLLTVQDVAALLRVPVSWVYDHVRPGCSNPLPHLKLGKYVRFSAADIRTYLERMRSRNGE